ncbi:MAG: hypothetical protein BGO51_16860 [Rhodospirillales bacterium 69-11]|nr:MAG: hypothetical protein BGO51_16860 [Rhodospirillales bacterium 69-11]
MGTSQSSGGPGGGVPMVPSWTPDPPAGDPPAAAPPADGDEGAPGDADGSAPAAPTPPSAPRVVPIAPPARFAGTRRSIGDFARTGDERDMRRSLGHYVRTGYGGSNVTTQRFGSTAATAGALGGALAGVASGQPAAPGSPLDPALLAGRSVNEVMDAVVEAVRPVDGTQDAEAERAAIRDALSELLTRFPEADLLNLDPDQRGFAIERFTAIDVFRRFELDVGKAIVEKAPSAAAALARLKQVRDYVKQTVAASFRKLREAGRMLTAGRIGQVVRDALKDTFDVFEGYAE